jgi:uncharacterized DUF497 family protein
MLYEWDEEKRQTNLGDHGLDFLDASQVFNGLTYTYKDDRIAYGERRFITLGLLREIPVSIVHTESETTIRVISFRRATNHEAENFFAKIQDQLPPPQIDEKRGRPAKRRAPRNGSKKRRKGHRKTRPKGRST